MSRKIATAVAVLILGFAGYQNCARVSFSHSSEHIAAINPTCPGPTVMCSVSHGSGTQSCTDSSSGPVYGDCVVGQCDPGYYLSNNQCLPSEFAMVVTGGGLVTPVASFTAIPSQLYDFKISGSTDAVAAGLDNTQSYLKKLSGQCSGNSIYQPFTDDLTSLGAMFAFGDNNWSYTAALADQLGGCVWQACASTANGLNACVTITAQPNTTTTTTTSTTSTLATTTTLASTTTAPTTTVPATTTTVKLVTTTTTVRTTTTTVKSTTTTVRPTTTTVRSTTTTMRSPTTTVRPPTTTVRSTTTTTVPCGKWKLVSSTQKAAGFSKNCAYSAPSSGSSGAGEPLSSKCTQATKGATAICGYDGRLYDFICTYP